MVTTIDRRTKPNPTFPFTRVFGGNTYYQALVNPDFVVNCTKQRAEENVKHLRKEGWAARVVSYPVIRIFEKQPFPVRANMKAYIVYERRTGKEMKRHL